MVQLQVDIAQKSFEFFGPWALITAALVAAVLYLVKKADRLEKEKSDITEKAIEAMTLGTKVIEDSQGQDQKLKDSIEQLRLDLMNRKCKYDGEN